MIEERKRGEMERGGDSGRGEKEGEMERGGE